MSRPASPAAQGPAVAVLAKQPRPGASKTRLSPPFTLHEAAALAEAMLCDVLDAVAATPGVRRVVVLEGAAGPWLPEGFELIAQRGNGHAERIAGAFADTGGPAVLIGMDTPQVTPALLAGAVEALLDPSVEAILGPAADGGWWAAGLKDTSRPAFQDVPMSRPDTLEHQRSRFAALGLRWSELEMLRDVDDATGARSVAALIPNSRFARLFDRLDRTAALR
ncbi:MAG: TIGR04282 family arsenosugar biosynthesis glycosyltransferase [Actinomycetota bacterium]